MSAVPSTASAATAPVPTPAATPSDGPSTDPTIGGTSPSESTTASTEAAACPTSALSAEVAPAEGGGAAGSVYWNVTFTNTGTVACTLTGYPGVSFADGAGAQVGEPADREPSGTGAVAVRLAPGGSASAPLRVTNTGVIDGCTPVTASSVVIYPPDQTASLTASAQVRVCQEKVSTIIGVFAPGA